MRRWISQSLLAALVLGVGGVGFWLGRDSHDPAAATTEPAAGTGDAAGPTATVQVKPVTVGNVTRVIDAYGSVQSAPGSSSNVSVPFDAIVQRVLVAPGTQVNADTPVVEVGPTAEAKLQLQQARDAVAAADKAVEDVHRRLNEQLATNADVATAEQAQQTARTQLASLQQRGIGETKSLPAGVAGYVAPITIQPGQVATAGTPLITIEPARAFEAIVGVEPSQIADVKVGNAVTLRDLHASPDDKGAAGTVRLIAPQINPQTRLRDVTVALPDDSSLLRGTFVVGQLDAASATGLVVPRSALTPDDDEQVLFVIRDDKAVRTPVKVVLSGREDVIVEADTLHAGDAVVVNGNAELEDGMAVKVDDAPTTEPTSTPATEDPK